MEVQPTKQSGRSLGCMERITPILPAKRQAVKNAECKPHIRKGSLADIIGLPTTIFQGR